MSKTWVLDTETKGTGAHMVPLEQALQPLRRAHDLAIVELDRPPRPQVAPEPPAPLLFKVVDVMSAKVLGAGVDAREAVQLLEGVDSVLDAGIYLWMPKTQRWRLLTLDERKTLWRFRGRLAAEVDTEG